MPVDLRTALAVLALLVAPLAAAAHHKDGHGGGGGQSAQENRGGGHGMRGGDGSEPMEEPEDGAEPLPEEEARSRPCAWGLAAREVACVPPGQARRGVTTEQWIGAPNGTLDQANVAAEEDFGLVANVDRLGLPPLPEDQAYAVAGGDLVVVSVTEGFAENGVTPATTYAYVSTVRRAAMPGRLDD